jgi:hypothetical protein
VADLERAERTRVLEADPSVEGYADLLEIASRAIRSRDPDAQLLLGGMFGHPDSPAAVPAPVFLDRL